MPGLRTYSMVCMLLALLKTPAAAETRVRTVIDEFASIFLTEIQSVQSGQGCESFHRLRWGRCKTRVRARISQVFKGEHTQGEPPAEFEVQILQQQTYSMVGPWSTYTYKIEPGQRFLILSRSKKVEPSTFVSAGAPLLVSDQENMIGDLELILNSEAFTLHQQAAAAAGAIATSGTPHSFFLAEYAAALLAAGAEADTMVLARAVQDSSDQAFSEYARVTLLRDLWDGSKSAPNAPEDLLKTYVVMTARYFLLPPKEPNPDIPDLRQNILFTHIPWLVRSERAKALIRTALPPTLRQQFRKQALEVAADEGVRSEHRLLMKELLPLIGPN